MWFSSMPWQQQRLTAYWVLSTAAKPADWQKWLSPFTQLTLDCTWNTVSSFGAPSTEKMIKLSKSSRGPPWWSGAWSSFPVKRSWEKLFQSGKDLGGPNNRLFAPKRRLPRRQSQAFYQGTLWKNETTATNWNMWDSD